MGYELGSLYRKRAWQNRCPRCGEGRILKNLFVRHDACSHCGLKFAREDGFFSAALPINYTLVCVFWIIPIIILAMTGIMGYAWAVGLCIGGALIIPILTYRYSQCLWLGAYYFFVSKDLESGKDIREQD